MFLAELELSIKSINILQKADVWFLEDIIEKMISDPAEITLALAKIKLEDFTAITDELKKRSENVLDKS